MCVFAAKTESLAGTGVSGAGGDGGLAVEAQAGNPYGLTLRQIQCWGRTGTGRIRTMIRTSDGEGLSFAYL